MSEIYLSAKEVAGLINSTVRTIENWAAASKIEQNQKGKYGLISAFRHQNNQLATELEKTKVKLDEAKSESDGEYRSAKNRKAIAEADKEESLAAIKQLELETLTGKLIDASEVEALLLNIITTCVSKFQGVPAKLALQITGIEDPAEVEILLRENIFETLSELGDLKDIVGLDHSEE